MSLVTFEMIEGVGTITVDNPPINLMDREVMHQLSLAIDALEQARPRAVLVRSVGDHFGAGVNIGATFVGVDAVQARAFIQKGLFDVMRLEDYPAPIICAVQGLCFAAGLELALRCDIIFAARSAKFAQVEQHIGATTYLGGGHLLAERCGPARAREICFTGATYSAESFERWNIVNYVVEDGELQSKAFEFAKTLAHGPTLAHAASKRLVREYIDHGTRAADRLLLDVGTPLFDSKDFRAGVDGVVTLGAKNFRGKIPFTGT
ncbi:MULTISPECIES: enoyl-CoA hydratase/isomerase family protein [unclassified Pseudomonas]|uniref:enoyl-CoA hydratase/isomerase family protein n=1 Tax=unclassified Pseudomonas TaxID=196821 RepID=UPI0024498525|nr:MULTISPECIES: enoyl-CoA hydratase/isomerase family protein [unclassified Pseudomonas]MDG9928182.1 enoyl-CoA hydratase/isomerase family protein [Pseudomonas sp. GD04042]MDH0481254.1 enoyl-CoA hydratase/isomerase family protein [Pseudomonas sp. GD04015]MDH0605161.1 enoyl-CoA hydratase/isomerase family protein [Pseudomonas sp. GD03869]